MMRPQPFCRMCGKGGLHADDAGIDIDSLDRLELLDRELLERLGGIDRGIVDDDVEAAILGLAGVEPAAQLGEVRKVRLAHDQAIQPLAGSALQQALDLAMVIVDRHDPGAGAQELQRRLGAEPAGRTGVENGLAGDRHDIRPLYRFPDIHRRPAIGRWLPEGSG